jgi:hypothetical protein
MNRLGDVANGEGLNEMAGKQAKIVVEVSRDKQREKPLI